MHSLMVATRPAITATNLSYWQAKFESHVNTQIMDDAAHDISHLRRVARTAISLAGREGANTLVVLAAAYFHDCVNVPKNHPDRANASSLSAERAIEILRSEFPDFPASEYEAIAHAIEAHSFSAGIAPRTIEAKVVQDADRLEALGAIGIARVFYIAGKLGQSLFDEDDPIATARPLDDNRFAVDHFRVKLLELHKTMQTGAGRALARENSHYMAQFLGKLAAEISGDPSGTSKQPIDLFTQGLQ